MKFKPFLETVAILFAFSNTLATLSHAFDSSPLIIGGVNVSAGDPIASSTVLLVGTFDAPGAPGNIGEFACSGTIISEDTLVTAAHCVAEELIAPADPTQYLVIFSTSIPSLFRIPYTKLLKNPAVHTIYGYQFDPNWKGTDNGVFSGNDLSDIAVIRFKGGLPPGYAPAAILPSNLRGAVGDTVTLAGYGVNYGGDALGRTVGTLRKVDVTVEQFIGTSEFEVDQTKGKGSCGGDSGGPALLTVSGTTYLWGLASRGDENCDQNGIYTDITEFTDFIAQAQQALEALP